MNNKVETGICSLYNTLLSHLDNIPDKILYTFISDKSEKNISFRQLSFEVNKVISLLRDRVNPGDRVLIICKPGFNFISSFIGCLAYGVVAVPLYPPGRNTKSKEGIRHVVNDCKPSLVLSETDIINRCSDLSLDLDFVAINNLLPVLKHHTDLPTPVADDLAFIQYTSGSTGSPKGVMISHGNLITNQEQICKTFKHDKNSKGVIWLPPYHDMGLIGGILQPLYIGFSVVLMAPMTFIQKPLRWLEAISKYKATTSGGPNFAYDLCVERISEEDKKGLDLSSWKVAFNGAEPISEKTLDKFEEKFSDCGFNSSAFLTCYGMAETTLIVTGRQKTSSVFVNKEEIKQGLVSIDSPENGHNFVSCGNPVNGVDIEIINSETLDKLGEDKVGEILVNGDNVASGYWAKTKLTEEVFNTKIKGDKRRWFKTGDLGFIHQKELFISGRAKDLIIIRGKNHFPQDIEQTVNGSYPDFKTNASAAFSININGEEKLIFIQEIKRESIKKIKKDEAINHIRNIISREHEIQPYGVALVKQGTIPKTTSGKIRRFLCRDMYQNDTFVTLGKWQFKEIDGKQNSNTSLNSSEGSAHNTLKSVEEWFGSYVAAISGHTAGSIDLNYPLANFGLDSLQVVTLCGEIQEKFGVKLSSHKIQEYDSLSSLCRLISAGIDIKRSLAHLGPDERSDLISGLIDNDKDEKNITNSEIPPEYYDFMQSEEYIGFLKRHLSLESLDSNPFFPVLDSVNTNLISMGNQEFINYSTNNFLGLSGHSRVSQAAISAIKKYGSSVSASRLISGERNLHRILENKISDFIGTEDSLVFVGAATANVSTIGHLLGKKDVIFYDEYSHDSLLQGIKLSHADSYPFSHNSYDDLEEKLKKMRHRYEKVLIFIEGLYSMDGDIPNLPKFINLKKKYKSWLMVDECLSIGVVGKTGRGIGEHYSINRDDVDIWMGGISKALGSCGGYIAGKTSLINYLKYTCPGFIFTTGMSPANTAAAIESLNIIEEDQSLVNKLRSNVRLFMSLAHDRGFNIGRCDGAAIVPIIIGDSSHCINMYEGLKRYKINVQPILYPAVAENSTRLRFSLNASHTDEQIKYTVDRLYEVYGQVATGKYSLENEMANI